MKQETSEAVVRSGAAVAGATTTWAMHDINTLISIGVGIVTFFYVAANLFFLVRKWYKLEKSNWKSHDTDRTPLGDK